MRNHKRRWKNRRTIREIHMENPNTPMQARNLRTVGMIALRVYRRAAFVGEWHKLAAL
jgi:hypothetical protein